MSGEPRYENRTILLVEDDPAQQIVLRRFLESDGYQVAVAGHGAEALALLADGLRPLVILSDLRMPVMDGWEFVPRLRANARLSRIPVVLCSSEDHLPELAQALGVDCYLEKPVKRANLVEVMRVLCP
jgi:CheY-like chemotaxis protein